MSNKKLPLLFDTAVLEDWLDDEHITAAQHLLQEQHPDVAGHCTGIHQDAGAIRGK